MVLVRVIPPSAEANVTSLSMTTPAAIVSASVVWELPTHAPSDPLRVSELGPEIVMALDELVMPIDPSVAGAPRAG